MCLPHDFYFRSGQNFCTPNPCGQNKRAANCPKAIHAAKYHQLLSAPARRSHLGLFNLFPQIIIRKIPKKKNKKDVVPFRLIQRKGTASFFKQSPEKSIPFSNTFGHAKEYPSVTILKHTSPHCPAEEHTTTVIPKNTSPLSFPGTLHHCHSEEQSDEESCLFSKAKRADGQADYSICFCHQPLRLYGYFLWSAILAAISANVASFMLLQRNCTSSP